MRNSSSVVYGGLLVAVGALWLLKSLDIVNFYLSDLFNYWYWLLIAAGFLLVVSGATYNRAAHMIGQLLLILSLIGGVNKLIREDLGKSTPFEWQSKKDKSQKRDKKQGDGKVSKEYFSHDMQPGLTSANLRFRSGAGTFTIDSATNRLFQADASSTFANYISNIKHNTADQNITVDFEMDEGDFEPINGDNSVNIQLNDSIKWDVDIKFGAGEGKFDFSKNILRKLDIKSGAASMEIKLGDKAEESEIDIKTGVASVEIFVPKSVSVEIDVNGALSSTQLPEFKKADNGKFRSPDYDSTGKKISIKYKGGLSSLKVERY